MKTFDFGKNWMDFSKKSLDENRMEEAEKSLKDLIGEEAIKNKTFLDIGSGSGIFSITAKKIGAKKVVGFDISENSIKTAFINKKRFVKNSEIDFQKQSILEKGFKKWGKFDIVYSWGVLHHTGDMWQAIKNSMSLVKKDGYFVIAIYNKHWTSPIWKIIKWFYNISPKIIKWLMIGFFYFVIAGAKFIVTGINPFKKKKRGMNFYYDVVDWVGGFPYQYASKQEMVDFFENKGFKLKKFIKSEVPTGCNEFVFKK
jgi:2-polyprenyl-6-hydroxyphenyl methylase/3-demethylubiquinone-9 3-methyltransferase